MAYGSVNSPGASEIEMQEAKEEVIKVSDKIGVTGDTGGSTTAGTVFGKLNKIISDLTIHMGRWTYTRAGYIDTINTNASAIKDKTDTIGETGDTGGNATAGTVMSKLNKLISDLATHISSWTSTRAGYIDTIKTDAAAIKTNTAASTTASASGTLSQKLTHIINLLTSGAVSTILDEIKTKVSNGSVKSIQRGVVIFATADNIIDVTVEINAVNPEKCMVILDGTAQSTSGSQFALAALPYLYELSDTSLQIKASRDTSINTQNNASWQVIEFY